MFKGLRYTNDKRSGDGRQAWKLVQKSVPALNEAQCREVIDTWLRNGVLYYEDYYDTKSRHTRRGLFVNHAKRPGNGFDTKGVPITGLPEVENEP